MNAKRLSILLVLILLGKGLWAQSNTMYYLSNVPQGYYLNPASQPQPNFFIGLPVLSSFYFDVYHNSLNASDFFWNDPNSESGQVLHPFHPDTDLADFINRLEDANDMSGNLDFNLVSMGFRIRSMYFTLDVTSKLNAGFSLPNDLVEFGVLGNEDNSVFDFSNMGFNFTEHFEIGLGVSRKFGDMITVGVRPKLLLGITSVSSRYNDISLSTSHDAWDFGFNSLNLQMATPGIIIPVNETGTFDPGGEFVFDSTLTTISEYRNLATGNKGFGVDIGVHIKPMDELTLSASIIDLGVIKWNNYIHTAELTGSFQFTGVEYSSSQLNADEEGGADTSTFLTSIFDTLRNSFSVNGSSDPFTTRLEPKVFIGASYSILPKLDIGMLARFDFPETGFEYDLMLHANWHPSTMFGLAFNYSPFEGGASTFGLGGSFRLGPLSIYGVADYNTFRFTLLKYQTENRNIPIMIAADNRTRFNLRIGLNLVLGWNQYKRLLKDKPMYYSDDY